MGNKKDKSFVNKKSEKKNLEKAATVRNVHLDIVVRLASRNIIFKKDDYYCITMKDQILELKDCPTLAEVYIYINKQDEDFKKKINNLDDEYSVRSHVLDLIQHPEKPRSKMDVELIKLIQVIPLFSRWL